MSKSGLLARQKAERELWTIKVIAYTEQQTLDAVCLALAEGFGFGEERLKRFHDAFNAKYAEIRELSYSRDPDEIDAIDDICFTCDECRRWHGADPRYRIQTRRECERYRESRRVIDRRAEAARKKFTIMNGGKING